MVYVIINRLTINRVWERREMKKLREIVSKSSKSNKLCESRYKGGVDMTRHVKELIARPTLWHEPKILKTIKDLADIKDEHWNIHQSVQDGGNPHKIAVDVDMYLHPKKVKLANKLWSHIEKLRSKHPEVPKRQRQQEKDFFDTPRYADNGFNTDVRDNSIMHGVTPDVHSWLTKKSKENNSTKGIVHYTKTSPIVKKYTEKDVEKKEKRFTKEKNRILQARKDLNLKIHPFTRYRDDGLIPVDDPEWSPWKWAKD